MLLFDMCYFGIVPVFGINGREGEELFIFEHIGLFFGILGVGFLGRDLETGCSSLLILNFQFHFFVVLKIRILV